MNRQALLSTVAARAFDSNGQTAAPAGYQPTPADIAEVKAAQTQSAAGGAPGLSNDPILKRSTDIALMVDYWDKVDTIIDGITGFRLMAEKYLPRFIDESGNEYAFRLKLTKVTNVFRDIADNLALKPFQEEVSVINDGKNEVPEPLEEFAEDVDGSGNNLTVFASHVFFNAIVHAVHWVFIDYSKADPTIKTVEDEKIAGLRPYWSHVLARNVLDAQCEVIAGEETLTYIKIFEPGAPSHVREFIREPSGRVIWNLYEKVDQDDTETKSQYRKIDGGEVSIGIIPLIKFATGRRDGRTFRYFPALADAADLQIELYQMESGLKFAKTLTAYPMLTANGVSPIMEADGQTPKRVGVGPNRVLYAPPHASTGHIGSWAFIEPSAESLKFLAQDIKDTITELRELGKQPLTAQAGLTVITTAVAAGKSNSAVKSWALTLKDALENALAVTNKWLNIADTDYDPTVRVFTEFDDFSDGKDVEALTTARTNKDISRETYWEELRRRSILSPEFDAEVEEQRLLDELPGDGMDTGLDDAPPARGNSGKPAADPLDTDDKTGADTDGGNDVDGNPPAAM